MHFTRRSSVNRPSDSQPLQPILVVLVWRGGQRFERALDSLTTSEHFFKRILLSVTANSDSEDVRIAEQYIKNRLASGHPTKAEIICSGRELPTMQHQLFWIQHLLDTGAHEEDWIYWLAYDDQLLPEGIARIVDCDLNWPLEAGHCYIGPWAMRHESPDQLWAGNRCAPLEVWTSFPSKGPSRLGALQWVSTQILQPTYIQMSGSVSTLASHKRLVSKWPKKSGPMRIEMATVLDPSTHTVSEFSEPVSIIYGRSDSDRAKYSKVSRIQDRHLAVVLLVWMAKHPRSWFQIPKLLADAANYAIGIVSRQRPTEEWRVRGKFEWHG